ncbi:MAG: NAD(P)-dependent oxidoreductase [Pelagimonas sp.]|uniref:NAD(P)-dependent oxidoreductase n=1 Tax=Pelagimonas sp. TaxID=2073170 RepID=UPI003D6B5278
MTTLVIGATGATGRHLVTQLLNRGERLKIIVRSPEALPRAITTHPNVEMIQANVLDLSDAEMAQIAKGCAAVASCLGHNMTFQGMFGHPRRLVTQATSRFCDAIKANAPETPVKFVLMNTTGNRNRDLNEPISLAHKTVVNLLRWLLPPHVDNEQAADYLRITIGQNDPHIQWSAVRPDGLTDDTEVTAYDTHVSPTRCAIFNAGHTSRINVAHFMAGLITDDKTWHAWRGKMPVIYNANTQIEVGKTPISAAP